MEQPERPVGPEEAALAAEADELRRQVMEGAGSQEELRELAARLRAHRAHEDDVWQRAVRPNLKRPTTGEAGPNRNVLLLLAVVVGLAVLAGVIVAVI